MLYEPEREDNEIASLCDLGGEDYSFYKFMMKGIREDVRKAILGSIYEVAEAKGIGHGILRLDSQKARQYTILDATRRPHSFEPSTIGMPESIPNLLLKTDNIPTLYIFIEPIFSEYLPNHLENTLLAIQGIERIKYVMLAEKGSPSPSMNWREREGEVIQGYKTYSLEEFFDDVFGHEEWEKLEDCLNELKDQVAAYCGVTIVKAVRPNSLRHFKLSIDIELERFSEMFDLTDDQSTLLDARFVKGRTYTALTGACDFAESFKTAEWLYKSLGEACGSISDKSSLVDLTPITASYFKAIEQFMYGYIALHTCERDATSRKLFVGMERQSFRPSRDYRKTTASLPIDNGYVVVNNQLMAPPFKEMLGLGVLTNFFGNRNQYGKLFTNNTDLLVNGAMECDGLYELIVDTLDKVTALRNGYFHKDNLHDWDKVDEVRDTVRLAFFLLLGACKMSHEDELTLGFDSDATLGDIFRLCDYINHRSLMVDRFLPDGSRVIPLFYCDEVAEPLLAMTSDSATVYDRYGNPAYDGVHFKRFRPPAENGDRDDTVFFGLSAMPKRLCEGYLELTNPNPFQNEQSGPVKTVFEEGRFLGALNYWDNNLTSA